MYYVSGQIGVKLGLSVDPNTNCLRINDGVAGTASLATQMNKSIRSW